MKRDVSFSLLGLILLLCLGILAASVFYQYTYNDLQSKYEVSNDTLHKTMSDYQEKEKFLDAALQNLSLSEEREEALGGKYQEVETEKIGLQTDLKTANEAIEKLNKQKEDLEEEVDDLTSDIGDLEFENFELDKKVEALEEEVKTLEEDIDDLNAKIAAMNTTSS